LVPAQVGNSKINTISNELEKELLNVAYNIPICIISSKDCYFLKDKVKFSKILSCILGIEIINNMKIKENGYSTNDVRRIQNSNIMNCKLLVDKTTLKKNSTFLEQIHQQICTNYRDLEIELKYTLSENKILCGITMDGRNLSDWTIFSNYKKKIVNEIVSFKKEHHMTEDVVIQTYENHPFIDFYACPCSKAMAYDSIANMLQFTNDNNVLYLGDSENDNSAFKKADISIGIRSDNRINTNLECKYYIGYENLALFLNRLTNNNFNFKEDLLNFDEVARN
jgi:trehalose-6-phosphatase